LLFGSHETEVLRDYPLKRGGAEIGPHQVLEAIAELQLLKQLKP
jgi:hypothetical protein